MLKQYKQKLKYLCMYKIRIETNRVEHTLITPDGNGCMWMYNSC